MALLLCPGNEKDGWIALPASNLAVASERLLSRQLQRNCAPFSVLDKSDIRFRPLLKTLDSLICELHKEGIGAVKNSAKVIDGGHELIFWEKHLLGYSTPKILQRTVFFYVGLNFALRGVQEQHDLVPAQFCRMPSDSKVYNASVYYEYTEYLSTNNQHRFKDINAKNKTVRAYAVPGSERCLVKLLDFYLALLPPTSPYFYMQGLEIFPTDLSKSAFKKQRVGVNTLKNMLPDLSRKSGIGVHYMNHSLHATSITRMFNSGIPEKVIAETSGHKSVKALRCCEHTSTAQHQAVTASVNMDANPIKCPDLPKNSRVLNSGASPSFSGNFQHCTINISLMENCIVQGRAIELALNNEAS